jgi:hypothetical protein
VPRVEAPIVGNAIEIAQKDKQSMTLGARRAGRGFRNAEVLYSAIKADLLDEVNVNDQAEDVLQGMRTVGS